MQLSSVRTLGRSGLPVSPFALGTMTFGNKAWGSSDGLSSQIFNAYVEAGGNFIDTADVYAGGHSEELLGQFIADGKLREKLVLATKYSFSGGNGRKNLHRALEGSLRRLRTDAVDLYWLHVWDTVTPIEEVLQSMTDLIRAGKIRYFALSDVPAWYAARMATLAQAHNVPGPIALQLAYSLVERTIEHEHIPAARELGLGITPWSPLAFGFLSGKYARTADGGGTSAGGRLNDPNSLFKIFSERNWAILETLQSVAKDLDKSPAEIALAWVLAQPGITSTILGANKLEHLQQNLAALAIEIPLNSMQTLEKASALEAANPYSIFTAGTSRFFGGTEVQGWRNQ